MKTHGLSKGWGKEKGKKEKNRGTNRPRSKQSTKIKSIGDKDSQHERTYTTQKQKEKTTCAAVGGQAKKNQTVRKSGNGHRPPNPNRKK